ncbi:alpha/beta hydrolase [Brachybacterium sp. P6-10-X1]|uniref:alpha/beta fold hydrolase n=1 Tax=Brachybacterium sp. P6-10-X1 TaxID=1903186 RepID=UPI00097183D6|nr:alpha/beta hydrolase [Brachybacterium sp. P6-10-X1]APX34642.1 alpha/beta hydrolase [Brachybacterium sp. P6-10-X1]
MTEHAPPRRPRRARRRRIVLVAALAGALLGGYALGSAKAAPIGHWRSTEGRAAYLEAYDTAFADLPEPADTHDVRTDYGVVRVYRFAGDGDAELPLVLLPGTASGMPVLADNLPSLLEVGDVYAMDLLGEPGRSIQDRPITSDADKAAWLHQALEALPEDRFHLLGLSIGGWTATNLALHHDEHLASLITLDAIQTYDDIPLGTVARSIPAAFPWMPKAWRDSFSSYTAGGASVEDVPVATMIESGMQNYRMAQPQPTRITPEQLATLEQPVLAILAGRSVMHDPEEAAATARSTLSDARVEVFPDASHAINGEYPEEIAALVDDFTTEVEAR